MDEHTVGLVVLVAVFLWVWLPSRTEINEAMERKDRAKEAREKRK